MQELQDLIVYALYVWIAASVVWLVSSLMRGRRAHEVEDSDSIERAEGQAGHQEQSSDADEALDLRVEGSVEAGGAHSSGTEPALARAGSTSTSVSTGAAESRPAQATAPGPEDEDAALANAASVETTSVDTDLVDTDLVETDLVETVPTLAALLSGIRLPHDLLPVLAQGADPSDQSVTLISNTAAPEVIGGAIADELERLGFGIKSVATDRALATREDSVISLRIAPDAGMLRNDDGLLFPDSAPGAVMVQLDLEQQA